MITIFRLFSLLLILAALSIATVNGQSPEMIVVQAATPAPPASATISTAVMPVSDSTTGAIKLLQELKAANEETLKKQRAALEQLDELQKAAEQMKAFSKRG
jgi:Skp family chaperone for outer membrane proteins